MASISKDPNGHRRIQFTSPDGKRKTIRLGKISERDARAVLVKGEYLVVSASRGIAPGESLQAWLESLNPAF